MTAATEEAAFKQRRVKLATNFGWTIFRHCRWLKRRGLLNRPWFVLASAPDPALPRALPDDVVYAYVKHAGRSARMLGLPKADVTLLNEAGALEGADDGVDRGHVLVVRRELSVPAKLRQLTGAAAAGDLDLLRKERDSYTIKIVGSLFSDGTQFSRPSMTIPMLCFALAHKVPQVILAGISLDRAGYSYDRSEAPRKHVREDTLALEVIAKNYPQVTTTEQGVHNRTGLPLFKAKT